MKCKNALKGLMPSIDSKVTYETPQVNVCTNDNTETHERMN